jgi:NTE family protein
MNIRLHAALVAVPIFAAGGCCSAKPNGPLGQYNPESGYRYDKLTGPGNSEKLFVILTFSGGGTRAAALAYGVMERLRNTTIQWEGEERRLLDEVDVISSVSGGSFTAAYYGLFREELFDPEKFEKVFLYQDIQGELITALFNPVNWVRLASPGFGRIDLAAELYDREIFREQTFKALIDQARRPYLMLNATDITMGSQFTFVQDQFDLICSDLGSVKVSRAVAASSNFPIAFAPMVFNNYAGSCHYKAPPWIEQASKDLVTDPPRFNRARIARSYLNSDERKYVHLLDGGVADNIGLRGPLAAIRSNDLSWSLLNKINLHEIAKLVVIVVDARTDPKIEIDKSRGSPGLATVVDIIASVPMSNYSFDTVQLLLSTFESLRQDAAVYAACKGILENQCSAGRMPTQAPPLFETFPIYVGFDQIKNSGDRQYFLDLPTTFALKKEDVDKLRRIGPKILDESEGFQQLCAVLKCQVK